MKDELDSVSDEELDVEQEDVPIDVICPSCSSEIEIPKLSTFRCPKCKSVSSIDEDGNISLRESPSTNFSQKFEEGVDKFSSWIKPTAQKFGEQAERTTQDLVSWGSSAGENISSFNINNDNMRTVRIWLFIIGSLFVWFLFDIPLLIVMYWFKLLGFSTDLSWEMSVIIFYFVFYFFVLRIYSYCTNHRNFEINSEILSDYDPYVTSHLFQYPSRKDNFIFIFKAFIVDTVLSWTSIFLFLALPTLSIGYAHFNSSNTFLSDIDFLFWATFVSICIAAPIVEELFFRGFVFDMFSEIYSKWTSIILTAFIFGLVHLTPITIIGAFVGGIVYGYVRHETNSLWPPIILHSLWNLQVLLLAY